MYDTASLTKQLTGLVGLYNDLFDDSGQPATPSPVVYLSDAHKLLRPDIINALGPDLTSAEALLAWYSRIEKGAINKLALSLSGTPTVSAVLNRQSVFAKEANIQGAALTKNNRFLAWRMTMPTGLVKTQIIRGGIQFTGPVTDFPLYLFHSENADPVAVINLTGNTANRTIWANFGEYLNPSEGYYLIGYYEADLPPGVSVIGREQSFTVAGCSSCNGSDYALVAERSKYINIEAVYVAGVLVTGILNWPDETVISNQTWGLNLTIEAYCDRQNLLVKALLYLIACDVLEEIASSDRVNGLSAQLRSEAYVALYGQSSSKVTNGALAVVRDNALTELKNALASNNCQKVEAPRRGIRFDSLFD
ncbi:hypothetical protein [Spirosoma spitsbergense]|uniref:hypothetical protein n=1 Tax=Spirosoma spitsbergense TaxID=431554 RepID=UPI00037AF1EB|nr:hypothetical protein [Spirosoma spitsbergense]